MGLQEKIKSAGGKMIMGTLSCNDAPQMVDPRNAKTIRHISIREVMNGFSVNVGCQELVFQSADTMLSELARYIKYPAEIEREYLGKNR